MIKSYVKNVINEIKITKKIIYSGKPNLKSRFWFYWGALRVSIVVLMNIPKILWYYFSQYIISPLIYLYYLNIAKLLPIFPWPRAKHSLAWENYKKTPMYEERTKEFGEKFAVQMYLKNREYRFFSKFITWKEWIQIIFTPYTIIEKYHPKFNYEFKDEEIL